MSSGIRNVTFTGVAATMLLCSMGYYASRPSENSRLFASIQSRDEAGTSAAPERSAPREIRRTRTSGEAVPAGSTAKMRKVAAFLILVPFLSHIDKG